MTDALSSEAAMKSLASLKTTAVPPAAGKPADKPEPAPAGDAPPPPPPPGSKTFLGWVASSVTKKQLTVGAAALCSLAAGIAAVRLLTPPAEAPEAGTMTQPLLSSPKTPAPETASIGPPKLTIDPKPAELVPPQSLPLVPALPPAAAPPATVPPVGGVAPPPPASLDTLPAIPSAPGSTPPLALPPIPGAGPAPTAAVPPPDSLVPAVIPAGGTDNQRPALPPLPGMPSTTPPAAGGSTPALPVPPAGPAIPPAGPAIPPAGPAIPPAGPSAPPAGTKPPPEPASLVPDPKTPPAPVAGAPLVPPVGSAPASPTAGGLPTVPPESLAPAAPPAGSGVPLNLIKPADSGAVVPAPAAVTPRTPTTTYDVDIYQPKAGDSWATISREFYSDAKYAEALRAYNQNRSLQGGTVDVPPIHVLRRNAPAAPSTPGAVVPAGRTGSADPWASAPAGASSKTYTVPAGGLSLPAVSRMFLGTEQRWDEIHRLNPGVDASKVAPGTELKLPADARLQ